MLNPPPEKNTAVSGICTVPPTAVTLDLYKKRRAKNARTDVQWTRSGEARDELCGVFPIVGEARLCSGIVIPVPNTSVPTGKHQGDAAGTCVDTINCGTDIQIGVLPSWAKPLHARIAKDLGTVNYGSGKFLVIISVIVIVPVCSSSP